MDKKQALQKIDEIHSVLIGSNKFTFPRKQFITIGILLCLSPLLVIGLDYLWMLLNVESIGSGMKSIVDILVFGSVFYFASRQSNTEKNAQFSVHPLLRKSFKFEWILAALIISSSLGLYFSGNEELVFPFILILAGFYYKVLALHTFNAVKIGAYGLMAGGVLSIYLLAVLPISTLWFGLVFWMGIMFIIMGNGSLAAKVDESAHGA